MARTTNKNKEVRSVRTSSIYYEKTREQQFREKLARAASNGGDTNLRIELQTLILNDVSNGKSKEEIIEGISKEEKFKRYEQFWETWIDHHMSNYNKAQEGKLSGKEVRDIKYPRPTNYGEARE